MSSAILATEQQVTEAVADVAEPQLRDVLAAAKREHRLRVTSLPSAVMDSVARRLQGDDRWVVRVHSEQSALEDWQASATKLIELRNNEPRPLLVFLPPGLRTPAEDSLDVATFTEFALGDVMDDVVRALTAQLPPCAAEVVKDALEYLRIERALPGTAEVARFLLSVIASSGRPADAGRALALLGLVPDLEVLSDTQHLRRRLWRNLHCVGELADDRRPLQERIARLKLKPGPLPGQLFTFLRPTYTEGRFAWASAIATETDLEHLTFEKWEFIDQPASTELSLTMLPLALPRQVPDSVGHTQAMPVLDLGGRSGLKLAFRCSPSPAQVPEWKHFRLRVMKPEAEGPVVAWESNNYKAPTGTGTRLSRTIKVTALQDLEEGTYYAQVDAFGGDGSLLNDSKPRDPQDPDSLRENESEYFLAVRDEVIVDTPKPRAVFVVSFEEAHGDAWARSLGESKKTRPAAPSRTEMSGSWREARTAPLHGDAHFVFDTEGVEGFTIRVPGALRRTELDILESPDRLGLFRLDYRDARSPGDAVPSVRDEVPALQSTAFAAFLEARSEVFAALLSQHQDRAPDDNSFRLGIVETADLLTLESLVLQYARSFVDLVEEASRADAVSGLVPLASQIDVVELRWRSQQTQSDPGRALLLGPTHPLRLLWHLRHAMAASEVLGAWESGTKDAPSFRQLYEEIQHVLRPQSLPLVLFDRRGRSFAEQELLTSHWSLFLPTEHDSQRVDLAACRDTARRLLGVKRSTTGSAVTATELAGRVIEFVRLHPYVEQIHINLFHPGDGQLLADTLQAAELFRRRWSGSGQQSPPELRYAVNMFTAPGKVSDAGLALEALLDPERQVGGEDEFSLVTGDHLHPKLVFSRNPVDAYLREPREFEAHISVLLEQFRVEGRLRDLSTMGRGSFVGGLVHEAQTVSLAEQEFAWVRGVNPSGCETDAVGSLLVDALHKLQGLMAAHASGEKETPGAHPALALVLRGEDQALIRQVHDASTWVLTIDRNLGLDFFDRPSASEDAGYLLDFTPEYVQEDRQRLLLTTKSDEELEALVRGLLEPALEVHPGAEATVLEALRSLSGRLALRLLGGPSKHAEVLGLLMARWMLERAQLLQNHVLIPVDAHQDWFRADGEEADTDRRRADLLLVGADEQSRTLEVHVIEVKLRRDLAPQDRAGLYQGMGGQAQNTKERFRRRFDPRYFPKERADLALRAKELSTLLTFYLGRSLRYRLVDSDRAERMREFFESLDEGYRLRFRSGGVVFVQEDKGFQVDDIEPDLPVYRFGSDFAQGLLDEAVELRAAEVEESRSRRGSDDGPAPSRSQAASRSEDGAEPSMEQLRKMLEASTMSPEPRRPVADSDSTADADADANEPAEGELEESPRAEGADAGQPAAQEEPGASTSCDPDEPNEGETNPFERSSANAASQPEEDPAAGQPRPSRPTATVAAVARESAPPPASSRLGVCFDVGATSREVLSRPIAFHPSNTALSHLNIGIVGDMGTGKTQLTKYLVTRFALGSAENRGQKPKFLIFDYKKDYSRPDFVSAVDAKCVSPEAIPLNILRIPPKADGSAIRRRDWVMRARFLYDALSKIYSGVGPVQRKRLIEAVVASYQAAQDEGHDAPLLSEVRDRYAAAGKPDSVDSILSDLVDLEVFTDDRDEVLDFGEFFEGVVVVKLNELGADQQLKNTVVVFFLNLFYDWMLRVEKLPFVGRDPQLRFIKAMLLIDEADNIMQYDFAVLQQVLQQGREFGVGVLLASQYLSHFFRRSSFDYREPLLTWFIHRIPNVTPKDLEGIGLAEVRQETVSAVKDLENHEYLCKTLGFDGVFGRGNTFWRFRQDAWVAQNQQEFEDLKARAAAGGLTVEGLLRDAIDDTPPDLSGMG